MCAVLYVSVYVYVVCVCGVICECVCMCVCVCLSMPADRTGYGGEMDWKAPEDVFGGYLRPWWKFELFGGPKLTIDWDKRKIQRSDMNEWLTVNADEIKESAAWYDREHPLLVPPPWPGQIWASWVDDGNVKGVFVDVLRSIGHESPRAMVPVSWYMMGESIEMETTWPPPNAVLIEGKGAPWAPPSWPDFFLPTPEVDDER